MELFTSARVVLGLAAILSTSAIAGCTGSNASQSNPDAGAIDEVELVVRVGELPCAVPNLDVRLEAAGVDGFCPLSASSSGVATGLCGPVPAATLTLRVTYDLAIDGTTITLATATKTIDATRPSSAQIDVEFAGDELDTDMDFDSDGATNISEVCDGTDPLVRG